MMIGISTVLFDLDGFLVIDHPTTGQTDTDTVERRVSRIATLDGGASVSDLGYTAADRTFVVAARLDEAVADNLKRLVKSYSRFVVCTKEGAFFGVPAHHRISGGDVVVRFLITGEA